MNNLKRMRENAKITQKELALHVGISQRTIQEYEQGRKSINRAAAIVIYRMANVLGCNMEEILELEKEE